MKRELGIDGLMLMYVGNLEPYQGIGLLLESFALVLEKTGKADLVIIGGRAQHIHQYQKTAHRLGIQRKVHFCGPRPLEQLEEHLSAADVLVSPRLSGNNTPMKLYSYLHSGTAVLATDLPTHTQLLNSGLAMLAEPSPKAFSDAMLRLLEDENLRQKLASAGRELIERQYSYQVFREKLHGLFDWLETQVSREPLTAAGHAKASLRKLHW